MSSSRFRPRGGGGKFFFFNVSTSIEINLHKIRKYSNLERRTRHVLLTFQYRFGIKTNFVFFLSKSIYSNTLWRILNKTVYNYHIYLPIYYNTLLLLFLLLCCACALFFFIFCFLLFMISSFVRVYVWAVFVLFLSLSLSLSLLVFVYHWHDH